MTVRHKLASLDDEQTRDLLLQVARGQEEMRYRLSRMVELMLDTFMGAEADEACGAVYMTRGEVGGNRRHTDGYETTVTSNRKNPMNRPLTQSRFVSRS